MAVLRLAIFVLRFLFVMAGVAVLWERTEGGIDVRTFDLFFCMSSISSMFHVLVRTNSTIGGGGITENLGSRVRHTT